MQAATLLDFEAVQQWGARWLALLAEGPVTLVGAALAAGVLVILWTRGRERIRARTNVLSRRAFSSPEGELWRRMQRAMPNHVIQMHLPLSRFMVVRRAGGLGRNSQRLAELSVDYAIFRADGTISSVVLMTESEQELSRQQRKLRRKLLERAQVRHVQWSLTTIPSVDAIAGTLDPDLSVLVASEPGSARRQVSSAYAA